MVTKKPSAAERTVDMFSAPPAHQEIEPEAIDEEPKADFEPMEKRADGYRDRAFKVQEWTTKAFGDPTVGDTNDYRFTRRDEWYYLEELGKKPDGKTYYKYAGLMLHKNNVIPMAMVVAAAARELSKESK